MNTNEEKLVKLIGDHGYVSLNEILTNLKVLKVETDEVSVHYLITRVNKVIPWPAPYQAGRELDGDKYYCCSYSTMDDEEYPEDTKMLNVYRTDMEE